MLFPRYRIMLTRCFKYMYVTIGIVIKLLLNVVMECLKYVRTNS